MTIKNTAQRPAPKAPPKPIPEFIPHPTIKGSKIPNPEFSNNKMELFKEYPATVLNRDVAEGLWLSADCIVKRMPSGKVQLLRNGVVLAQDVKEGKDFKLA